MTNLDSFKLKEFADDNFKFDEYGRKLPKWVETTEGKGEIAHYVLQVRKNQGLFGKGIVKSHNDFTYHIL